MLIPSLAQRLLSMSLVVGLAEPPVPTPAAGQPPAESTPAEPSPEPSPEPPAPSAPEGDEPSTEPAEAPPEASTPAPSTDRERAAALFLEGTEAYELGRYPVAVAKFEEAWKLAPEPALLFNLGQAHWRWFDVDPDIEHLRTARTFFQNYDKRMRSEEDYFPSEVNAFITALNTQIQAEEQKQAERDRPVIVGPSVEQLEAAEQRKLRRERNLRIASRINGTGIAFIVVGSVALVAGIGATIARVANGLILENTTGSDDANAPSLVSAREDADRRSAYQTAGQVAFGSYIAGAIFLPVGIGLRVGGAVIERRELGSTEKRGSRRRARVYPQPGALLTITF